MKRLLYSLLIVVCATLAFSPTLSANDLEQLSGTWTTRKTNEEGQAYKQTIEIKKDKLTFKILGPNDRLILMATADVKVAPLGPFKSLSITNIKAGGSADELEPVSDDRTSLYRLEGDKLTLVTDLDKERDQKPALDIYTRQAK